ncbi:MAG: M1 family metallopeptidase [Chitinophagaceae bacterium]|nr:M1 family metallopeptidase [Chitinophagaceae bacterium]MBP9740427.1 M1 family metallopeptidase [Chitinophagaceae bacterium]
MTLQRLLLLFIFSYTIGITTVNAQLLKNKPTFTKADTLRGSLNENRDWWDVLRYDITVKPDFEKKEIEGKVILTFTHQKITKSNLLLQLDLQEPLIIDSIIHNNKSIEFTKNSTNTWLVNELNFSKNKILSKGKTIYIPDEKIEIYYHGKPKEAKTPPWDGGWIWKKDKNGNPWMSVAVQGLGASAWYPCKDYQGDEPDNGASLMMIVPDSLVAVSNGRLTTKQSTQNSQHQTTYSWEVKNPINSYCIVPYIGKYVNFTDTLMGEKGKLDLSFWVLDYNLEKAKEQFKQVKPMLRAFEYWFGPYPFYKDSYKLVDAPHLGMEHQSAVAYGNQYKNGYLGSDRSGKTGWGLKWDFIIVHESGHEWFANNITTKDIADMWVHESFTTYSETLFTEFYYGKQAANEYNYGQRRNIRNEENIIGIYGVNKEGSGDMYDKGSNMLHSIRHSINNDVKFRKMLRGMNAIFYHKTVTTQEIETYINKALQFNFQCVFNQYLRTTQIPVLEYYVDTKSNKLYYKYSNCIEGFNLPIWINVQKKNIQLKPTTNFSSLAIKDAATVLETMASVELYYYLKVKEVKF